MLLEVMRLFFPTTPERRHGSAVDKRYFGAMKTRSAFVGAAALLLALVLSGCGGTSDPAASTAPSASPTETVSPEPSASSDPDAATVPIPTDCRAILSPTVLAELDGVPLNDPAFDPSGSLEDGSLRCVWADPAADTTSLVTEIKGVAREDAMQMLNALANDDGFTCYSPDGGTRCEKTWDNETYPVTDGRTLFWRDGVLIDTRYSNLAPSGYTAAVVAYMFPTPATPSPTPTP